MNKYKKFVMEARGSGRNPGTSAAGFGGKPKPKARPKPTKEQLMRWHKKTEEWQQNYLKKYPNSIFQQAKTNAKPNIITRARKLSSTSTAIALRGKSMDVLKAWGIKNKTITKEKAHSMLKSAKEFLKGNRDKFIQKATDKFESLKSKLPKSQQQDVDQEAKEVLKSNVRPSKRYDLNKGLKGVLPALLGAAVMAAVFGGFVPVEVMAFAGVKLLDAGFDAVRHLTHESGGITTFLAGSVIKDYMKSKDSDDDVESAVKKIKDKHGDPDESEAETDKTEEPKAEEVKPESPPESTKKDLGFDIDQSKYEKDENGNWKRKVK